MRQVRNRMVSAAGILRPRPAPPEDASATAANIALERDLPSAFLWASAGYRPQAYHGPVALLFSEDVLHGGGELARDWREFAPQLSVHPLHGSHLECITAHVKTLSQTIDECLRNVRAERSQPTSEKLPVALPVTAPFDS